MRTRTLSRLVLAACLAGGAVAASAQVFGAPGGVDNLRAPAGAGSYYPAEPYALQETVRKLVQAAPGTEPAGRLLAVVTPHAPFGLAGEVIASGFKWIQPGQFDRVIVLGPSQNPTLRECSIADVEAYVTPLGMIPIDRTAVDTLRYSPVIKTSKVDYRKGEEGVHEKNVSIEVVLPFLQERIGVFRLVPIVVGDLMNGPEAVGNLAAVARAIRNILDERTLIVATCNFTHYGAVFGYTPFGDAAEASVRKMDEDLFARVLAQDGDSLAKELRRTENRISGQSLLQVLMLVLPDDAGGMIAAYDTSGHKTGRWENSISFGTLVFNDAKQPAPESFPQRKLSELTGPVERPQPEPAPIEAAPAPADDAAKAESKEGKVEEKKETRKERKERKAREKQKKD